MVTGKYALIGYPLGYSLSPALHNNFFEKENISAAYEAKALLETEIESFVKAKEYTGFNVTIPYKETIIPYLDRITSTAHEIGAVNTVKLVDNAYIGDNTDAGGFGLMLKEDLGINMQGMRVLLLGAGGAAKAISYRALKDECRELLVFDTSLDKTESLLARYSSYKQIKALNSLQSITPFYPQIDMVINATPVGMKDNSSILNSEEINLLPKTAYVIDIIYSPLETPLLKIAREFGLKTLNGVGMLAGQGILGEKLWFNKSLSYQEAKAIISHGL